MVKWLLTNSSIMQRAFFTEGKASGHGSTLPDTASPFLQYYHELLDQATAFWKRVALFREAAQALYQLPPRIAALLNILERDGQTRYYEELGLVEEILADLRGVAAVKGVLRFTIKGVKSNGSREEPRSSMFFANTSYLSWITFSFECLVGSPA